MWPAWSPSRSQRPCIDAEWSSGWRCSACRPCINYGLGKSLLTGFGLGGLRAVASGAVAEGLLLSPLAGSVAIVHASSHLPHPSGADGLVQVLSLVEPSLGVLLDQAHDLLLGERSALRVDEERAVRLRVSLLPLALHPASWHIDGVLRSHPFLLDWVAEARVE